MVRTCVAALAVMLGACGYDADFEDCTILCSLDTGCPGGLTCGAEGLCRNGESIGGCHLSSDGVGGSISHADGRTIHTFSTSYSGSTFSPPVAVSSVEVLVVGGGGGGGTQRGGGGGGAGGFVYVASHVVDQPLYLVTVGRGGGPSTNGEASSFGTLVAFGGGAGRNGAELDGGSGGGASHNAGGGSGTAGQGNGGGTAGHDSGSMIFTGAGGGGAGGQGEVGTPSNGGTGGPGLANGISGTEGYYAGGGGGGGQDLGSHGLIPGDGGNGSGGNGGVNGIGKNGVDGTGGGGGGGGGGPDPNFFSGGRGGAGVVIVSYPMVR